MRTTPPRLFDVPPKPRAKPRKLMHVYDAGPGYDEKDNVKFLCPHCGHESEWMLIRCSDAKRGIPCPECNHDQ